MRRAALAFALLAAAAPLQAADPAGSGRLLLAPSWTVDGERWTGLRVFERAEQEAPS